MPANLTPFHVFYHILDLYTSSFYRRSLIWSCCIISDLPFALLLLPDIAFSVSFETQLANPIQQQACMFLMLPVATNICTGALFFLLMYAEGSLWKSSNTPQILWPPKPTLLGSFLTASWVMLKSTHIKFWVCILPVTFFCLLRC